jgi:hypothetical protein
MSGTAALAAARKRRANPQIQPQNNVVSNSSLKSSSNSKNVSSIEENPKATNPAMLLMQHNMSINNLQKEVAELKESKLKDSEIDYKTEYLVLLEEMKEMKKVLLKVQSFSMETNLEVMKLKRNSILNNSIPELVNSNTSALKIDLSSITITNDIDHIETIGIAHV